MIFDRERLDAMIGEGWLRSQRHPDADLWIYNYTERVQYEGHWTPETLACRGLILDADGEVVARPFPKFFNYGDPQIGGLPDEPYTVTEKLDGSLGIYYEIGGEGFIASRGSFTSEQAELGTQMLADHELEAPSGVTPLFEIVYPENRIVVDYAGRSDLFLLGAVDNETARTVGDPHYTGPAADRHWGAAIEVLVGQERPNREGYVVTFESGLRVKIKHAEYVRLHRIVTGINARAIWDSLRHGDEIDLDGVPDEIYGWVKATEARIREHYETTEADAMEVFAERPEGVSRKETAAYFVNSDVNPGLLFSMLDGKDYSDAIWRMVKPEAGLTPSRGFFA